MPPQERTKIKTSIIGSLPCGFTVVEIADLLREIADEIEELSITFDDEKIILGDVSWAIEVEDGVSWEKSL
jgi:hypothetical protein